MTRRHVLFLLAAALPFGLSLTLCGCAPADAITLQGCGATFPAPLYKRWFLEYYLHHPQVRTNYQAIGSGAGQRQLAEGLVEFGATDESLDRKKLAGIAKHLHLAEQDLLQVPLTAGAVALCYNLPGVTDLKLPRAAYVGVAL